MSIELREMTPLLQVFDMPTSLKLYCDVLGFEIMQTDSNTTAPNHNWVRLRRNNIDLMLNSAYEADARPSAPDSRRIASHEDTGLFIGAPDVDAVYVHLRSRGIDVKEPQVAPYGMKQLYVHDPDGFALCFQWATKGWGYVMLRVEILKRPDGTGLLRCTRGDGSVTWQKQEKHSTFFALHDLTHYAVETALRYDHGFFGLIASGWDIEETTGKGSRGELPPQALEVEKIVGLFDSERASGVLWDVEEFNKYSPRKLTDVDLRRVRNLRGDLFKRWDAVEPGGKLELEFEPQPITEANHFDTSNAQI